MNDFDTSRMVRRGEELSNDIEDYARRMSEASRAAINDTNPGLEDTELGIEWPLTDNDIVVQRLISMVVPTTRSIGIIAVDVEKPEMDIPEVFMGDKVRNDVLVEAYSDDNHRRAFALDVLGWVKRMEMAGWRLLVRISVFDLSRVELDIYEDTDKSRAYFRRSKLCC